MIRRAVIAALCMSSFLAAWAEDVPAANPRIPAASWAATLNVHPRLFGSKD